MRPSNILNTNSFFPHISRRYLYLILPTLPAVLFLLIFILGSVAYMIAYVLTKPSIIPAVITSPLFTEAYFRTLRIGLIVAAICTLLSYPSAYYVMHLSPKWRNAVRILVFFPYMVNPVVRAFGWMIILGREGLINSFLSLLGFKPVKLLYTELAVVLGLVELVFPFMFVPLLSAMENVSEEVVMAARSLGAGTLRLFAYVIAPLTMKGYLFGLMTVLTGSVTAYVIPSLLGGFKHRVLSMLLYEYVEFKVDYLSAAVVAITIIATVVTITGLFRYVVSKVLKV